ncbi:hypothetical protein N8716_00470 [Pontimonas sp.]|nr:hypothetical protein [Pontimonas sp.]
MVRVVLTSLASLLAGAAVGVVASVYHSAWFPLGLVIIMVALGAGLMGLRVFFRPRYPAALASLGLISAIVVLAGQDGQGSVLIAGNSAGLSLLVGVSFFVVVANAWPRGLTGSRVKMEYRTSERTRTQ